MGFDSAPSSGQVPGAGDQRFGDMGKNIAEMFGLDLDPKKEAFCKQQVRDTIDDLNRKKLWRFNLILADDVTTVSGEKTIAIPADMWRLYSVRKSSDIDYQITDLQQRTFDILFQSQNNITGFPYVSSNFNVYRDGTLRLFPTPDGSYTITLRYFKLITKPNADGEFLDLPRPYQTVPKYGACSKVAALLQQPDLMRYWEGKYQEAYADMNRADEDIGDEDLRFVNVEEMDARSMAFINPALRPRYLDFY